MTPADLPILVLDFETVWDSEYTLSKRTTEEYIRDHRFHAYGVGYKWFGTGEPARWVPHAELQAFFDTIDWSNTAVLAHNAAFDVSILAWRYGHVPVFIYDSLCMARAVHGIEVGNSLSKLADRYGLPAKGNAIYSTRGQGKNLPGPILEELAKYCCHDVDLCELVFTNLYLNAYGPAQSFPPRELRLIDMTLRMYVDPVLELDTALLEKAKQEDEEQLQTLLTRTGVKVEELASNDKFVKLLQTLGVEVPSKTSKVTGFQAPALAKSDVQFQALLNHEDENVALLCQARLKVKSTLERTRAQRFLDIASRGALPIPLKYYGASTGRWAAAKEGINPQNLKRRSFLRRAIKAPPGYVLVVGDLAQIEPRVLAWYAGYETLLETFRSGVDAYSTFGAQMFGISGLSKDTHPLLRQSAKSALLGCGYGVGWPTFAGYLLAGFLGAPPQRYDFDFYNQLGGDPRDLDRFMRGSHRGTLNTVIAAEIPHLCTTEQMLVHCAATKLLIQKYRTTAVPVCKFWNLCDDVLRETFMTDGGSFEYKGLRFVRENGTARIFLPNDMAITYDKLDTISVEGNSTYVYNMGDCVRTLYGSKMVENIVQAVARIILSDAMIRVQKRYRVVHSAHDELVALAPESEADEAKTWVLAQMTMPVPYLPGIPISADGGWANNYGDAKQ